MLPTDEEGHSDQITELPVCLKYEEKLGEALQARYGVFERLEEF